MAERIPDAERRVRGLLARTETGETIEQLVADLRATYGAEALDSAGLHMRESAGVGQLAHPVREHVSAWLSRERTAWERRWRGKGCP